MKNYLYIIPIVMVLVWILALSAHAQWRSQYYYTGAPPNVAPTATPSPYATVLPPASWTWNGVQGVIPAGVIPTTNQPLYYVSTPASQYHNMSSQTLTYNYVDPEVSPVSRGENYLYGGDATTSPTLYVLGNSHIPGLAYRAHWNVLDPRTVKTIPPSICNIGTVSGNYCWGEIDKVFNDAAQNSKYVSLSIVAGIGTPIWVLNDITTHGGINFQYYEYEGFNGAKLCNIDTIPAFWTSSYLTDWGQFISDLATHLKATTTSNLSGPQVLESTLLGRIHSTGINSVTEETDLPLDKIWPYNASVEQQITCTAGNTGGFAGGTVINQQNPSGTATCGGTTDAGLVTEWGAIGWTVANVTSAWNAIESDWETSFGTTNFGRKVPVSPMIIAYPTGTNGSSTASVVGMPGITGANCVGRTDSTTIPSVITTYMGSYPSSEFGVTVLQNNAYGGGSDLPAYPFINNKTGIGYPFTGLGDIGYQAFTDFQSFSQSPPGIFFQTAGRYAIEQGATYKEDYQQDLVSNPNGTEITNQNSAMMFPSGPVNLINLGTCGTVATPVVPQHFPNFSGTPGLSTGQWCYDLNNVFGNNSVGSTVDIYTSENPGYAGGATPITYTITY